MLPQSEWSNIIDVGQCVLAYVPQLQKGFEGSVGNGHLEYPVPNPQYTFAKILSVKKQHTPSLLSSSLSDFYLLPMSSVFMV